MSSPIADLSYRPYDGPLNSPSARWWVIAKVHTLKAFRNRFYWLFVALSGWYYLVVLTVVFVTQLMAGNAANVASGAGAGAEANDIARQFQFVDRLLWKHQFLHGFSYGQLTFLIITLMVGAGAIANDNRSNALLVYLSKPCTKMDYLAGKFFGVWIPIFTAMVVPSLFFFLYGLMSYRGYGFGIYAPSFLNLLAAMALAAGLHTSIMLGISSLLKQGRVAGIIYGAMYMITNLFTFMIWTFWVTPVGDARSARPDDVILGAESVHRSPVLQHAFYSSIDGLNIAITKAFLNVDGGNQFGTPPDPARLVPAPNGTAVFWIIIAICAFWLFVFWRRVRAVEVVS